MVGGSGVGGESFYDAASGVHHGAGSPQAGRRSDVAARVERETAQARLRFALAVVGVLVLGVLALVVLL